MQKPNAFFFLVHLILRGPVMALPCGTTQRKVRFSVFSDWTWVGHQVLWIPPLKYLLCSFPSSSSSPHRHFRSDLPLKGSIFCFASPDSSTSFPPKWTSRSSVGSYCFAFVPAWSSPGYQPPSPMDCMKTSAVTIALFSISTTACIATKQGTDHSCMPFNGIKEQHLTKRLWHK